MDNHTSNTSEYKTCTKCGEVKPRTEFHKRSAAKDGLRADCKLCHNKEQKIYVSKNKKNVYESNKKYYIANKDKFSRYSKKYYESNFEKSIASSARYKKTNHRKYAEYENKRRARKLENGIFEINSRFLKNLYSSPCLFCKTSKNVEADHIIPLSRGGRHSEGNLQPLCRSCNASKSDKLMIEWRIWKGIK